MNLIHRLQFSSSPQEETFHFPPDLIRAFELSRNFFSENTSHKLCFVFPSKEYAAQWLSIPFVLENIRADYSKNKEEIFESYRQYKLGEKLILNNDKIVEWIGVRDNGVSFRTKSVKESSGAEITIRFSDVYMLQRAPRSRQSLSSLKSVKGALNTRIATPIETLLQFDAYGNREFIKSKTCLITKYVSIADSVDNLEINHRPLSDYFSYEKIDDSGNVDTDSPLMLSNKLRNLALYSDRTPVQQIIIDSFSILQENITDFSDIDTKKIPTILITDLSEIESFEFIHNFGFEFFNFSREKITSSFHKENSPFNVFNEKLRNYLNFQFTIELCEDADLEIVFQNIHSITTDKSNNDLNVLKVGLIQLANYISRICHVISEKETKMLEEKLAGLNQLFSRSNVWLGDSRKPIEESLYLLKMLLEKFKTHQSEKCIRLNSLIALKNYDYIICASEDEATTLRNSMNPSISSKIISASDVDDTLLSGNSVNAILTGWLKTPSFNRLTSSFLISELTALFYKIEKKYYTSLQKRNKALSQKITSTIRDKVEESTIRTSNPQEFEALYSNHELEEQNKQMLIDIRDFELSLERLQFLKYSIKDNLLDSEKAKRVEFENGFFVYAAESFKLLIVQEQKDKKGKRTSLHSGRVDGLNPGTVIAWIKTDRDILADLVERSINKKDLQVVKQWIDLWKTLLREYFISTGSNFKKLIYDLRQNHCTKHEVTIRNWLQDKNRIGPEDDSDLISIALLTKSELLNENISNVRNAISKMTGWRMKAADHIVDRIKTHIQGLNETSIVNKRISVEGLGSVVVLKVSEIASTWENIDIKYVNKLLQKETV